MQKPGFYSPFRKKKLTDGALPACLGTCRGATGVSVGGVADREERAGGVWDLVRAQFGTHHA